MLKLFSFSLSYYFTIFAFVFYNYFYFHLALKVDKILKTILENWKLSFSFSPSQKSKCFNTSGQHGTLFLLQKMAPEMLVLSFSAMSKRPFSI
jgi:hypothetical protein